MVACLRRLRPLLAAVFAALAAAGGAAAEARCPPPKPFRFEVEGVIRRSATGFTQGLEFRDGALFESTGRTGGETRLNRIATDGKVSVLADQGDAVFGEGLTIVGDEVFQLTWQDHLVFVYDLSGKLLRKMHNPRLGWGLASDGKRLFFTDGEGSLHVADPQTFKLLGEVPLRATGIEAPQWLNELEYVDGKLYGNVWMTDVVVRVDPESGCLEGIADLSFLAESMSAADREAIAASADNVLNGIARDPGSGRFYITGKRWPMIYAGRFRDAP